MSNIDWQWQGKQTTTNAIDEKMKIINQLLQKIDELKKQLKGKRQLLAKFESNNFSLARKLAIAEMVQNE